MYTSRPFGEAIDKLLRERNPWPYRPNYQGIARELGVNYATLRSAMYGRTQPSPDMMQRVAGYLGVDIDYFREYRMQRIAGVMEARPDLTGKMYEYALSLLEEGDDERPRSKKRN